MLIDLACLAVLALSAYLGWRRGLLLSALALASVLLGYLCAYLFFRPLGNLVGRIFSLQPLLAYPLGGLVAFLLAALVLSTARVLLRRRRRAAVARGGRLLLPGRVAGATISVGYAAGLLILALWGLSWGQSLFPARAPDVRSSVAGRLAAPLPALLARHMVAGVNAPPVLVGVADRLVRDPRQTMRGLSTVLRDPRVRALGGAEASSAPARSQQETLRALAADPEFLRQAEAAGFLQRPEAGPLSAEDAQAQLGARLAPLQRALEAAARDPEVRRRLEDHDLRERLRRHDLRALANDPAFNALAEKVLDHLRRNGSAGRTIPAGAPTGRRADP